MAERGNSPNFAPKARLVQDARPVGGWQGWDTHRKVPGRGPPGLLIFAGVSAFCVWGLWRIAKSNQRREADKQEAREARINLIPLLQAEEDRRCVSCSHAFSCLAYVRAYILDSSSRFLREHKDRIEEEALIMRDVPGWTVGESPYKTRWMPPYSKPHAL
eukprot:TRINITY_DN3232_c0_g1_i1.p1 TRINITY_DN3232_c0_g1~~TRINITY_DN3232_c0_g1_i1.p1  ORF type:complete len:160 (-),score=7.01 TRINITY_DN3232_c0_g1_i1:132-611(-)